eukprot:GILI01030022.1.p1 GENE.GILI01030022.1~~GILI01030022.1.p1  ORF type:complete len:123 (-),score=7.79 GILI01030022.1:174-542(-)
MSWQGMRFCRECNNMLYPREDKGNRELLYSCRNCQHEETVAHDDVGAHCVLREEINTKTSTKFIIRGELVQDPTLPRSTAKACANCGNREAVFFQAPITSAEEGMTLIFVCTNPDCGHNWKD